MIEFKKNVGKLLPYNRRKYMNFNHPPDRSSEPWYGVSYQVPNREYGNDEVDMRLYYPLFEKVVKQLDNDTSWIVCHDFQGFTWFPNDENNLLSLRMLFKQNSILSSFKGALIFSKDELLKIKNELLSYPHAVFDEGGVFYSNLDISHDKLPLVIKVSSHYTIDLLSNDEKLLKKIVLKNKKTPFNIVEYNGTDILY